jgi:hypothetical protein
VLRDKASCNGANSSWIIDVIGRIDHSGRTAANDHFLRFPRSVILFVNITSFIQPFATFSSAYDSYRSSTVLAQCLTILLSESSMARLVLFRAPIDPKPNAGTGHCVSRRNCDLKSTVCIHHRAGVCLIATFIGQAASNSDDLVVAGGNQIYTFVVVDDPYHPDLISFCRERFKYPVPMRYRAKCEKGSTCESASHFSHLRSFCDLDASSAFVKPNPSFVESL